jgi:hypothetical protein
VNNEHVLDPFEQWSIFSLSKLVKVVLTYPVLGPRYDTILPQRLSLHRDSAVLRGTGVAFRVTSGSSYHCWGSHTLDNHIEASSNFL